MNRSRLFLTLIAIAALSDVRAADPAPKTSPFPTPTDDQVKARASALEVAGAFSNDGFKIRDGHAFFSIAPKAPKFIQVNLSSGNQYWFIAAGAGPAKRLAVSLYDENGKPVPSEAYDNNAQAAAGFSPQVSGPYIVRVDELEGEPAVFCLLYSYK